MGKILLSITQIADKNQREVVIPEGYTKIGDGAFRHCTSLEKVVIPNSVTEIGEGAFRGYKALEDVVFPDSLTEIG
ncbi:MAG: leucine-rich repeat domain-containing protein, partial [Thermoguttaceae bacterium]|nr:leucine-rich repeat domain-containing protein [Thermoguttaceae bacterium]